MDGTDFLTGGGSQGSRLPGGTIVESKQFYSPVESMEVYVDDQNKRELWFFALGTLAAAPVFASVGLVVISGIVAW